MNETAFVEERSSAWSRLRFLCDRADVSPRNLTAEELAEMIELYRQASADLSYVRTRTTQPSLVDYLNDLTARAYATLYQAPRRRISDALRNSINLVVDTVRRRKAFIFLAIAIDLAGMLVGMTTFSMPEPRSVIIPPGWEGVIDHWTNPDVEGRTADQRIASTGFYLSNNPRVAVVTASLGVVSFGVLAVSNVFRNGLLLGGLMSETAQAGTLGRLLIWISPHGVTEIQGMYMAAAAGFVMGWALINPGRRSRADALKHAGSDAICLLVLAFVMMIIAAPFEGFFSFDPEIPNALKVIVAAVMLAGWLALWTFGGKREAN